MYVREQGNRAKRAKNVLSSLDSTYWRDCLQSKSIPSYFVEENDKSMVHLEIKKLACNEKLNVNYHLY